MKRKGYHEAREKKKDQRATVVSLSERQVVERSLIYSITARLVSFFGELCSLFLKISSVVFSAINILLMKS